MAMTESQQSAYDQVKAVLSQYGLEDLFDWAKEQIVNNKSEAEVLFSMQEQPKFKQVFPEIDEQRAQEIQPWSPGRILEYRTCAAETLNALNVPSEFFDDPITDFKDLILGGVSVEEVKDRAVTAVNRVLNTDPLIRDEFNRHFGIAGDQALMALYLDPDRGQRTLERMTVQAEVGAAGLRQDFTLSMEQIQRLETAGVDRNQALAGFSQAGQMRHLATERIGEREDLTDANVIDATFGTDATSKTKVAQRIEQRQASLSGGGTASINQGGINLGEAD